MLSSKDRERIARGALLLDEQAPGWAEKIDLDDFDVQNTDRCPVTQVFGAWSKGVQILGLSAEGTVEYGFFPEAYDDDVVSRGKNEAWEEEVLKRIRVVW